MDWRGDGMSAARRVRKPLLARAGRAAQPAEHASDQRAPRAVGVAIITVSDTRRGADDVSGALAEQLLTQSG